MTASILTVLVVLFVCLLHFVYDGYLRCLRVIAHLRDHSEQIAPEGPVSLPSIAVVIAVHNEAHQIVERVQNVLAQDYPKELLEVIVASDGSTDQLGAVIEEHFGDDVRLISAESRVGKSSVQNQAVDATAAPIVLCTDADTRFAPGFLEALVAPFTDESVGAVQAHLLFVPADPSAPLAGQARYWRAELEMRKLEASLGILAVASGACIALRRELWLPLDPRFGEDCVIPLDVVLQSRKVAYAEAAVAYEPAPEELGNVIGVRARMTLRNWQGTWSRSALLNPLTHPGYAFALWSHKVLRWLSPIWLLGLSISAFALPFFSSSTLLLVPAVMMTVVLLLAAAGGLAQRRSRRLPVCTAIYAFMLANIGFLSGLMKAVLGVTISDYPHQPVPAAGPVNRSKNPMRSG